MKYTARQKHKNEKYFHAKTKGKWMNMRNCMYKTYT
jgi:uncharacterized beta-barrel protein YwiB (DUF1934 family)